jgi:myo-inositol-1-phosphate synthase
MKKINVAIIGIGNCASSLVQGIEYYKNIKDEEKIPGLMHTNLGGYKIKDINIVCGFDIDKEKVGKDISEAIFAKTNNSFKFSDVPFLNAPVYRGMTHDGLGKYLKEYIEKSKEKTVNVVEKLKKHKVDVVLNYLPVGSEQATKWYMEHCLTAKVGVVNCMPVFIASDHSYWENRFKENNIPIIGDDIKSQVGATIVHRVLTNIFKDRGVKLLTTSQLNVGGNTDFMNMLERERLKSKKISKTNSVQSQLDERLEDKNIYVGPSDYVPFLEDKKWCYISMKGQSFGDVNINLELKLEVEDSPNSGGVVIDALRCVKLAMDNNIGGPLYEPSSYFMKTPPEQYTDSVAKEKTENFILSCMNDHQ